MEKEEEYVILVTPEDEEIGIMPKMEAHEKAALHRAFSVFVMNSENELLLQKRAEHKYHSPGLWTNTCCSHQRRGESNVAAGKRRLQEEMGIQSELKELFSFIYKAPFDNGLTEYELDHVLLGQFDGTPQLNPEEAADWKWLSLEAVQKELKQNGTDYTAWFRIIFDRFYDHYRQTEMNHEG